MNYFYSVYLQGCWVKGIRAHSYRQFINSIRTINWQLDHIKVRLRINYGIIKDVHGLRLSGDNEGTYTSKRDLFNAITAFRESEK